MANPESRRRRRCWCVRSSEHDSKRDGRESDSFAVQPRVAREPFFCYTSSKVVHVFYKKETNVHAKG
jgi:hypothetical protein